MCLAVSFLKKLSQVTACLAYNDSHQCREVARISCFINGTLHYFFVFKTEKAGIYFFIQDRRKNSCPNQVKNISDRAGLGNCWNEGKGIGGMVGTVSRVVPSRVEYQEARVLQAEKATSPSLWLYAEVNENWGEEICLKMGLAPENLNWVIYERGNFFLGERGRYLGNRLRDGPYSCPMCGEMDESLHHFLGEFRESRELRLEIFGREIRGRDWILEIYRSRWFLNINILESSSGLGRDIVIILLNN